MGAREISWLRESIGALLIPELEKQGFRPVPLTEDEARSEIGAAFPFGRLSRAGPAGVEVVEVQLDKHGRLAFRLNVGTVPPAGINHAIAGFIPNKDVWVTYLDRYHVLAERSLYGHWFSPSRSRHGGVTRQDIEGLVRRVVGLLEEVDALFGGGKRGPHIREVLAT